MPREVCFEAVEQKVGHRLCQGEMKGTPFLRGSRVNIYIPLNEELVL